MLDADLDQPVVVTCRGGQAEETIRFDSLRKALHSIILDFEPELLPSAFICTKQGGLNIVEIRALYNSLCKAYGRGIETGGSRTGSRRSPLDA